MIRSITFDEFCDRSYPIGRSEQGFAQSHPDAEVRAYCEIDSALATWPQRRMNYAAHLRLTRKLDAVVTVRAEGLPVVPEFQQALHSAYREAFALSPMRGVFDMSGQLEMQTLSKRAAAHGVRWALDYGLRAHMNVAVTA